MRAILFMLLLAATCTGCYMDEPFVYDQPQCGGHAYYSTPINAGNNVVPANYVQTQEPEMLPAKR